MTERPSHDVPGKWFVTFCAVVLMIGSSATGSESTGASVDIGVPAAATVPGGCVCSSPVGSRSTSDTGRPDTGRLVVDEARELDAQLEKAVEYMRLVSGVDSFDPRAAMTAMHIVVTIRGRTHEARMMRLEDWISVISFGSHAGEIRSLLQGKESFPEAYWMAFFERRENFGHTVGRFSSSERDLVLKFKEAVAKAISPANVSYMEAVELWFVLHVAVSAESFMDQLNNLPSSGRDYQAETVRGLNVLLRSIRAGYSLRKAAVAQRDGSGGEREKDLGDLSAGRSRVRRLDEAPYARPACTVNSAGSNVEGKRSASPAVRVVPWRTADAVSIGVFPSLAQNSLSRLNCEAGEECDAVDCEECRAAVDQGTAASATQQRRRVTFRGPESYSRSREGMLGMDAEGPILVETVPQQIGSALGSSSSSFSHIAPGAAYAHVGQGPHESQRPRESLDSLLPWPRSSASGTGHSPAKAGSRV